MPTKTKSQKVKNLQTNKKFYVCSTLFNSAEILEQTKELCEKERSTYRKFAPSEIVKDKKFKPDCELVKKSQKVITRNEDGGIEEKEMEFHFWDSKEWRFFIRPQNLQEFEEFVNDCGFEASIRYFYPDEMEEYEEKWVEQQLGVDPIEDPFAIVTLLDEELLDEMGCDDPNCSCHDDESED